ncbi:hypothetical protein Tco_0432076 [Tanacetum coccineum]
MSISSLRPCMCASAALLESNYGVLGRYGVSVPALTKDQEGHKTNTPYLGKAIRRIQAIWESNILEDVKRGPYSKKLQYAVSNTLDTPHGSVFILDKLTEVAESSCLSDKMKVVFDRARSEEKAFVGLMRDLCFSLRISLSKKRRLVAELEALVEWGDAATPLEHMREIVARDSVLLGELEKYLARAQVGVSLKDGYVTDMEEKE